MGQDSRNQLKRRPLVVRFGSMGDMVIALTLIHALHQRFGEPVDVVSSGSWTRSLLGSQPGVGDLYLIRSRKMPYLLSPQQRRLVRTLHARGASPTWICDADDKCRWLIARAGIPDSHIVDVRNLRPLPREHAVDRWIRFARISPPALGELCRESIDASALRVPPLRVQERWRTDLDIWLRERDLAGRPLVLIQAGNRRTTKWGRPRRRPSNTKHWPEERWASVVDSIARSEPDAEILLTGVPRESQLNEAILYLSATSRAHNVAQELPLHRLLTLQERAIGMISVDTGPAHSAAALGCPLVVLFGTADPDLYAPRSPNHCVMCLRACEHGRASMLGISVDQVVNAWHAMRSVRSELLRPLRRMQTTVHSDLIEIRGRQQCASGADTKAAADSAQRRS
jgi:ADP-heptose:LPS heptosyltransferase